MGFMIKVCGLFLILFVMGCAGFLDQRDLSFSEDSNHSRREERESSGQWQKPVMQEVRVPAHIVNGVFYPEHDELVVIQPGQWSMDRTGDKGHRKDASSLILKDSFQDITPLPRRKNYFKEEDL